MDFDLVSLKDVVEALDKLADLAKKLGGMVSAAAEKGVEVIERHRAERLKSALSDFLAEVIKHRRFHNISVEMMLAEPEFRSEHDMLEIRHACMMAMRSVLELLEDLEKIKTSVSSEDFYDMMIATLNSRLFLLQTIIRFLGQKHDPGSNSATATFFEFRDRYRNLMTELESANKMLAAYIRTLHSKNRKRPHTSSDSDA